MPPDDPDADRIAEDLHRIAEDLHRLGGAPLVAPPHRAYGFGTAAQRDEALDHIRGRYGWTVVDSAGPAAD